MDDKKNSDLETEIKKLKEENASLKQEVERLKIDNRFLRSENSGNETCLMFTEGRAKSFANEIRELFISGLSKTEHYQETGFRED